MKKNSNILFYTDKPVFGLDIGFSSIKVMQLNTLGKQHHVIGYGVTSFDSAAIKDGIIIDPEALAKVLHELFSKNLIGDINTRRVSVAVPVSKTFSRTVSLPKLPTKELDEAVRIEIEQYIPVPYDDLYVDYSIISKTEKDQEVQLVAVPKKIIDSYMSFLRLVGLEVVALETTIAAGCRLFVSAEQSSDPTVLIDFGSMSADITVYDKALIVTGAVPGGGDIFTDLISKSLKVTRDEAHTIKTKYGLGLSKKQAEIKTALNPLLDQLIREIRRMMRYYEERSGGHKKIVQVVTLGGGANMPGLSEYMTNQLRIPVRMVDPWHNLNFNGLQPPGMIEKSMYATATGLALLDSKEAFL